MFLREAVGGSVTSKRLDERAANEFRTLGVSTLVEALQKDLGK